MATSDDHCARKLDELLCSRPRGSQSGGVKLARLSAGTAQAAAGMRAVCGRGQRGAGEAQSHSTPPVPGFLWPPAQRPGLFEVTPAKHSRAAAVSNNARVPLNTTYAPRTRRRLASTLDKDNGWSPRRICGASLRGTGHGVRPTADTLDSRVKREASEKL